MTFWKNGRSAAGRATSAAAIANNANANRVPGFVRWDSTVAYQITKNVQLRVNGINLTNQLYFDSISGSKAVPAAGRTFIGSLSVNF